MAQVDDTGTVTHMHPDALGSVRFITDDTGALDGSRAYDPWGTPIAGSTGDTRFGFAGEWADQTTNLINLRARWYDPATGQFLTRDPLYSVTGDRYGYAAGNPAQFVDPSGLFSFKDALGNVAKVAGVVSAGVALVAISPIAVPAAVVTAGTALGVTALVAGAGATYLECAGGGQHCTRDIVVTSASALTFGVGAGSARIGAGAGEIWGDLATWLLRGGSAYYGAGLSLLTFDDAAGAKVEC